MFTLHGDFQSMDILCQSFQARRKLLGVLLLGAVRVFLRWDSFTKVSKEIFLSFELYTVDLY